MRKIDVLVAEIGSTTTVLNAFDKLDKTPEFIAQGQAPTTVSDGDVNIGLENALNDLEKNIGETIEYDSFLATSSAAGGLKMTVHGLVHDMTVKAAQEAALGAGANIKFISSGLLRTGDLFKIKDIKPNIIMIAGGVDFGERETAIKNAEMIRDLNLNTPVIYAGNIENAEEIKEIFKNSQNEVYISENVYPRIDFLNTDPSRKIIQKVFERHITQAHGMERIRNMVNGQIMSTPGAVMEATMLFYREFGDVVTFDIGGATTDVHSATEGSEEIQRLLTSPEPKFKRTVEGDIGLYVNRENIYNNLDHYELSEKLKISPSLLDERVINLSPIPADETERRIVREFSKYAVLTALKRHAGGLRVVYGPSGRKTVAEGKDLSDIRYIIGTGGALSRLENPDEIIKVIYKKDYEMRLFPKKEAKLLVDKDYIMASLGILSTHHESAAIKLLKKTLSL